MIIAGTDGTVYVCRADDGRELWRLATGGVIQASPVVIDYNRDGVPDPVVALVGGEVLCLDGRGRGRGPVWRYATGAVGGVLSSPWSTTSMATGCKTSWWWTAPRPCT